MSDIRHSLLRRDALSAAKEVLYHLDIYFSSQLQSAPLPIVDKGPVELLEEFVFQVPKERGTQPKVRRAHPARLENRCPCSPVWRRDPKPQTPFLPPFAPLAFSFSSPVAPPLASPALLQLFRGVCNNHVSMV